MSTTSAAEIHDQLDHPIIDCDGHVLEFIPAAYPHLRESLGSELFENYHSAASPARRAMVSPSFEERRQTRVPQAGWWGSPVRNTRDLAAALSPGLLHEILGEIGFDFAVLYPTNAMGSAGVSDDDMRIGLCRGFNEFFADVYGPFADRLTVSGIIPMNTPDEAVAELEHCKAIGLKVVGIPNGVLRPIARPAASPWLLPGQSHWWDYFGLDSAHDYDPVWAKFEELGFAVTVHGGLGAPPTDWYHSTSSWMANHIGSFAGMTYPTCKSLFLGGVTRRFPNSVFAFQECGVGWAPTLLADTVSHWEKRNLRRVEELYDPQNLDAAELERLVRKHSPELFVGLDESEIRSHLVGSTLRGVPPEERDEWIQMAIDSEDDFRELFVDHFYFGCEADDRSTAYAFSPANVFGAELKPMLGSDIGHFDVPDYSEVLPEAFSLVAESVITPEQFRRFTFSNVVELFQRANPGFFDDTALADAVARFRA